MNGPRRLSQEAGLEADRNRGRESGGPGQEGRWPVLGTSRRPRKRDDLAMFGGDIMKRQEWTGS